MLVVRKIAAGGVPVEQITLLLRKLLPLYDSLIYHWMGAGKSSGLLEILVQAVATSVALKKFDKVSLSTNHNTICPGYSF